MDGKLTTSDFFPLVYGELRRLAAAQLAKLRPGQTLQPTALVNEAYLKLVRQTDAPWDGSAHFFGAAAQAMREIVVDHVRRRTALKRGGGQAAEPLSSAAFAHTAVELPLDDALAIDAALRDLERTYPRQARVVVMRYFAGMSVEQIAASMKVTTRTVEREWRFARALLAATLAPG